MTVNTFTLKLELYIITRYYSVGVREMQNINGPFKWWEFYLVTVCL